MLRTLYVNSIVLVSCSKVLSHRKTKKCLLYFKVYLAVYNIYGGQYQIKGQYEK